MPALEKNLDYGLEHAFVHCIVVLKVGLKVVFGRVITVGQWPYDVQFRRKGEPGSNEKRDWFGDRKNAQMTGNDHFV